MDVTKLTGPELIKAYNDAAFMLDRPQVKRFADHATAEKRTAAIVAASKALSGGTSPKHPADMSGIPEGSGKNSTHPTKDEEVAPKAKKAKAIDSVEADKSVPRSGTNREKLVNALVKNAGNFVAVSKLQKAVYGDAGKHRAGPLMMIMNGFKEVQLPLMKSDDGKPYELRKLRENKENHFGLFEKGSKS